MSASTGTALGSRTAQQLETATPLKEEKQKEAPGSAARLVKIDKKGALAIREMILLGHGYPFIDTDEVLALKALVAEREGLVAMRRETKTRMEAHAAKQETLPVPMYDSFSGILAALRKGIGGGVRRRRRPRHRELVRRIRPGPAGVIALHFRKWRHDRRRARRVYRRYQPVPLRGKNSWPTSGSIAACTRAAPRYISKRGNGYLRHLLFNAAFIAQQKNPELKTYFFKKTGEGRQYFSALCAGEQKLIYLIYAVWNRGTPYEMRESTAAA